MTPTDVIADERTDLLTALHQARRLLRYPTRNLTDEQAAQRTTVSELCLGGLIKHVTYAENLWADFIPNGPGKRKSLEDFTEEDFAAFANGFRMMPGETLTGLLEAYDTACRQTDEAILAAPDLNATWPLPQVPWFPKDAAWSIRRVILHLAAETTQHAGHADILREALDGARSMADPADHVGYL